MNLEIYNYIVYCTTVTYDNNKIFTTRKNMSSISFSLGSNNLNQIYYKRTKKASKNYILPQLLTLSSCRNVAKQPTKISILDQNQTPILDVLALRFSAILCLCVGQQGTEYRAVSLNGDTICKFGASYGCACTSGSEIMGIENDFGRLIGKIGCEMESARFMLAVNI